MPRLALLAALVVSFGLIGCESMGTQSKPASPTAGTSSSSTPTGTAATAPAGTPAAATPVSVAATAVASQASSTGNFLVSTFNGLSSTAKFSIIAGLCIFGLGYLLLQIHSGGSATGEWHPLAGIFGHLFTGFTAIALRLFTNTVRFILSGLTFTPLAPVSLITGLPKPRFTYNPHPAPSPTTSAAAAKASSLSSSLLDPSVWTPDSKGRIAQSSSPVASARSSSGVK